MGMAPLASFLSAGGDEVCGFDDCANPEVQKLILKNGVEFRKANKGESFDEIVISTALKRRAQEISQNISCNKIFLRGEKWSQVCSKRKLCAIVGSHGKSSVAAMSAFGASKISKDLGYLIGALPKNFEPSKFCKEGNFLISEIDESDGTIGLFEPEICLALNSDLDHVDTYADADAMGKMFEDLFSRTKSLIIIPSNDDLLKKCAEASGKNFKIVDLSKCSDFRECNAKMAGALLEEIFGKEFSPEIFKDYAGLKRRQEILADSETFFAISDYAHHPREVSAFLDWFAKKSDEKGAEIKIIAFQPHRYTRTKRFAREFAKVFSDFTKRESLQTIFYILPVYPASEVFDETGQSAEIFKFLREYKAEISQFQAIDEPKEFIKLLESWVSGGKCATGNEEKGANFEKSENCEKISLAFVGAGDAHFLLENALKNFFNV